MTVAFSGSSRYLCFIVAALAASPGYAQNTQTVPAKLICSAHTAAPKKMGAYQVNLQFTFTGDELKASRKTTKGAEESFTGVVSPGGNIVVTGKGAGVEGGMWIYEFRGKREAVKDTVLAGRLENTAGAVGKRDCKLIFLKARSL